MSAAAALGHQGVTSSWPPRNEVCHPVLHEPEVRVSTHVFDGGVALQPGQR